MGSKLAKRRQTVTATMPVSVTLNGNVEESNNVTDRQNGLRNRSRLLPYAICVLLTSERSMV